MTDTECYTPNMPRYLGVGQPAGPVAPFVVLLVGSTTSIVIGNAIYSFVTSVPNVSN